jgi:hypothetical protein
MKSILIVKSTSTRFLQFEQNESCGIAALSTCPFLHLGHDLIIYESLNEGEVSFPHVF